MAVPIARLSFTDKGRATFVLADTPNRQRRINPEAGHALEILGHAVEYLTDEYVHTGKTFSANDPEVKAVQLLMSLNRQIYLECHVVPTLAERLRAFLHLSHA
jgi:hypothetical protein